jgi:hypothetical protein
MLKQQTRHKPSLRKYLLHLPGKFFIMPKHISFNPADFEPVKKIALCFPGAEESVSHYDTPSVKINGKFMCRLVEGGDFIPIHLDFDLREQYLEKYPDIFHVPDHYKNYKYICMWVNSCNSALLKEILELSWKGLATKKQLQEWENR